MLNLCSLRQVVGLDQGITGPLQGGKGKGGHSYVQAAFSLSQIRERHFNQLGIDF